MWVNPKQQRINDMAARKPHLRSVGGRWECRTGDGVQQIVGVGTDMQLAFANAINYRRMTEKR